jgi:hypothetical protein
MTGSWPCNDRLPDASRWCILDSACFFPACGQFGSCWAIWLTLHPRFRYRVYGQSGCSRLSPSVAPGGNPDVSCSVGDRPFVGLQLRARVLGAPDEHVVAQICARGGGKRCTNVSE